MQILRPVLGASPGESPTRGLEGWCPRPVPVRTVACHNGDDGWYAAPHDAELDAREIEE